MKRFRMSSTVFILFLLTNLVFAFTPSGLLEIHYINVQTAGCTLVIGPDGTTILMDAGSDGNGYADVIPYLQSIGLTPADDLDYMMASHLDSDHCGGLDEVILGGYDVREAVYYNGSDKWNTIVEDFFDAAAMTTAGGPDSIPLGTIIPLGDGATATCVCVHGHILGDGSVSVSEENDKGAVLLIKYGEFEYIFGGDLGGGEDDFWCTGRNTATNYANVETPLAVSLTSPSGANLLGPDGVEVLHVNHHGSESSTNSDYMNYLNPSVACINVGWGQSDGWDFPRHDVVDNVLLAEASACVDAPPAMVFQTEEGSGNPDTDRSYSGYAVGDIIIKTNGQMLFQLSGSGRLHGGPDERGAAGLPRYFPLDEDRGDDIPPDGIDDLYAIGGPGSDEVTLSWTAPGDDGSSGLAAVYDIRYRRAAYGPIDNESGWNAATRVENTPSPNDAGSEENFVIPGLLSGQSYYFAIKTMDDNINLSDLSNSPAATAGYVPLLVNGDMEAWDVNGAAGPPDNWDLRTASITATRESSIIHGGSYSAKVTWTDTAQANCEFFSDLINVTEGEFYTCSLYVYDNDIGGYISPYFMWNTGNFWGPSTYNSDIADWQLLTMSEQAPTGATTLRIVIRCYDAAGWDGQATVYFDDITLNEGGIGNQPPEFGTIYRFPYPAVYPENDVAVRAEITDDGAILKDSLYYQISTLLVYTAVGHDSVVSDTGDYYWYTIPAADAGTLVEYYVIAEDDSAQRVESPVMSYSVSEHPVSSLANGDFESWTVNGPGGPPDHWTKDTGGFTASREETIAYDGNYSVNLTWTSTQTQILNADPIDVTGGVAYPCSVYVYDNDPAGRFRLSFISDDGNFYPENYSSDQPGWQHLGYTWIAPANATWVTVQLRLYDVNPYWSGTATVYADNVVFIDTSSSSPELIIYDLQFNNTTPGSACYDSPYLGQTLPITGTVAAIQQGPDPDYYLQDCSTPFWNGIYIFDNTQSPSLGQNVTVNGQVSEYYGMTEIININSFEINSSGNAICTTLVSSDDISPACNPISEAYEGMLVRLNNVTCVQGPDYYGVGYLKSPGAADSCAFDDELHLNGDDHPIEFVAGQTYQYVIGIVQYSYDEYKINPRFASDVVLSSGEIPYVPGDANMLTGQWPPIIIGSDVTYLVNYFRGLNQPCLLGDPGFYCAADANGDCQVIGSDVTKMVNYFRGLSSLQYCADYEPLWLTPADCPPEAPDGWPNCEMPALMIKDIPPDPGR